MHVAVGTSLSTIIATSLRSLSAHTKAGAVDFAVLRSWTPWFSLGALLGAALAGIANAVRLWGWQPWRTGQEPMLWVLHLGYGWLVLGLGLTDQGFDP